MTSSTPAVSLRPAKGGDERVLAAIDQLVNPDPWVAGQFADACGTGALERALVAESDQGIVGFIVYACVVDEVSIHNVAVHPASQRMGIGRALLEAALEAARTQGAQRCYLEVRASNRSARALYQALGFQTDGLRKNYYGGAGHPGAGHPGAGRSGDDLAPGATREDALLLSLQL